MAETTPDDCGTHARAPHALKLRRLGIDTYQEPVVYMRSDCHVCRAEGFESQTRIVVHSADRSIVATLHVVTGDVLAPGEAALSDVAFRRLGAPEESALSFSHAPQLDSLGRVRAKVYGQRLTASDFDAIVGDVARGRYSDVEIACFLTACAGDHLALDEVVSLTKAMIRAGERLDGWPEPVADKHCVGGLPGNRTTMIVVPILACLGITVPKTSSRAITSPAGTADAMECVAPVELDLERMRRVVNRTGACIVWGGSMHLSPADDVLIRVERALDIDATGQLVASVLSKKAAAGSTHVLIDVPQGPTAKIRTRQAADELRRLMTAVGREIGLDVRVTVTDGSRPVGRGIGPALEARDVLRVLRRDPEAPQDLRDRALYLAGEIVDLVLPSPARSGIERAERVLAEGAAWTRFLDICEAQGGFREPRESSHRARFGARRSGRVSTIDNRRIARVAKLAGAPKAAAAGVHLDAQVGELVQAGQALFTVHAETPGELEYALEYARANTDIFHVDEAQP